MRLLVGDSLVRLLEIPDASVDAVVTDPPYGLEFMGKGWDGANGFRRSLNPADTGRDNPFGRASRTSPEYRAGYAFQEFCLAWSQHCLRVLKPGGHLLAFGGSRTYHRLACAVEDAGFTIRDQIQWVYGQGMPKSHNLKGDWQGWGSGLKPAHEPIVMAQKSLAGTIAANVRQFGCGALNIDASRVAGEPVPINKLESWSGFGQLQRPAYTATVNDQGRWPANLIHDGSPEVLAAFPDAPGQQAPVKYDASESKTQNIYGAMKRGSEPTADKRYTEAGSTNFAMKPGARRLDSGSAARFFQCCPWHDDDFQAQRLIYCAKATKTERGEGNIHPTVKPLTLMRYLVRLVTPPRGLVLDPFLGSGTTGMAALIENFDFLGIEQDPDYFVIAKQRISSHLPTKPLAPARPSMQP